MIIALQTLLFFRQSLFHVLHRLLQPYFKKLTLSFNSPIDSDEEDDEEVFADFDDEKGVVFFPPVYAQRYAAVSDCLMDERWRGKLAKVVDLGHHDMSFIKYLKEVPGVNCIYGVDLESIPLRCSSDLLGCEAYSAKRENPLKITLFQGNAADPDYRLIGCDAVVAIEMIEHMLPQDLERLVHTVFGFIKPWIVVFTTPNGDFNVLFKAMQTNGLRRLDHFFEWTREQFHDWCSNIVARYSQYTVTCKGIGPGPPGTLHYGCCSQLALFINKDYQKQDDLNINSLALVARVPSSHNVDDMVAGWESPPVTEPNMICPTNADSLTRLEDIMYSAQQSCITFVISPSFSIETLEYRDKTSQCNLDVEIMRNFLMFNDEDMCFTVLVPRRKLDNKVYDMEDVTCRLNCSTYQVRKFSKTTQKLMAKNKIDSLIHTREVVAEIRHLSNMLNFNKEEVISCQNGHVWCNINWGDNAPYWNQYYKIVREYNYPFETKSDECRILELISEEINRLIDNQYDEEFAVDVNKLEIPMDHLLKVVRHITEDVDKVKDILEWNGYEVVDDVLIHSRLVVAKTSLGSNDEEWPAVDDSTDWDTSDVHSTSVSDGSTMAPDYHGRALRRALDMKVRKLRTSLSTEADMTTELDRVVCRLMKLALCTSKSMQHPPPARWMQCKLLDLLTLTEKAISRRKKHQMDSSPLRAICFGQEGNEFDDLNKIGHDISAAAQIVNKYQRLLKLSESIKHDKIELQKEYRTILELEGIDHDDFTNFDGNDIRFSPTYCMSSTSIPVPLKRTQAWLEEDMDLEIIPFTNHIDKATMSPSEHSTVNEGTTFRCKKGNKKLAYKHESDQQTRKKSRTNVCNENKRHKSKHDDNKLKGKNDMRLTRTLQNWKLSSSSFVKRTNKNRKYAIKNIINEHKKIQSTASKPIPGSIIELCHPELPTQKIINVNYSTMDNRKTADIAATKESLLIDIVTDDTEETIALRRTIGTVADTDDLIALEYETVVKVTKEESFDNSLKITTDNVQSQTIFLNDINEPSTSKGVCHHVSMDVQCGPDTTTYNFIMPSPVPSYSKMFTPGIKIGDSLTNLMSNEKSFDSGTCTNQDKDCGLFCHRLKSPSIFSKGIRIEDSTTNLTRKEESFATSIYDENFGSISPIIKSTDLFAKILTPEHSCANIPKISCDFGTSTNETETVHSNIRGVKLPSEEVTIKASSVDVITKNNIVDNWTLTNVINVQRPVSPRCNILSEEIIVEKSLNGTSSKRSGIGTFTQRCVQNDPPKTKTIKFVSEINDGNLLTDLRTRRSSFGTSAEGGYKTLLSLPMKSLETKIKDSDMTGNNFNCVSRCTGILSEFQTLVCPPKNGSSATETKMIKAISSRVEIEDSGSDLFGSCGSQRSTPFTNLSKNKSNYQFEPPVICKEVVITHIESKKLLGPALSRGGVHIHSYREQQTSEDIVYQGDWQRNKQKVTRKKIFNPVMVKKVNGLKKFVNSKDKLPAKRTERIVVSTEQTKQMPVRTIARLIKPKINKDEQLKKNSVCNKIYLSKIYKSNKVITRVASKVKLSSKMYDQNLSKSINTARILKRPSVQSVAVKKTDDKSVDLPSRKSYIPLYLMRRKKINHNNNLDPMKTLIKINKQKSKESLKKPFLLKSKTEKIKKDLVKFSREPRDNISYVIYRNEIDNVHNSASDSQPTDKENNKNTSATKRSVSPISHTSSTCSSPNSIATVRGAAMKIKVVPMKYSTSNKSSLVTSESESSAPVRNRKFTKRCKILKKAHDKCHGNKENVPESSYESTANNESEINIKSPFIAKKLITAQFATENPAAVTNLPKHKGQNANKPLKIPTVDIKGEKKRLRTTILPKNKSSNDSLSVEEVIKSQCISPENFNLSFQSELRQEQPGYQESVPQPLASEYDTAVDVIVDNQILTQWLDSTTNNARESTETTILTAMRQIVEQSLQFIDNSHTNLGCNSENNAFYDYDNMLPISDRNLSLTSFKTVITNENLESSLHFNSEIEEALNRSFHSTLGYESMFSSLDTTPTTPELLSFKSITPLSRMSEYFLADNDFNESQDSVTQNVNSVLEIFERKDQPLAQNCPGVLATQVFSGFSMNDEPIAGDQPDYVNFIDSETGSLALGVARQTTSEEVYRSSESFESCVIDEDVVVPNWLFNIISQQQSMSNQGPPQLLPVPMPVEEPMVDANGNLIEPNVGLADGAGDGRGMHSDGSPDSSGRGTSLSSSAASSGHRSEAILIDPSTFTAQFEHVREPMGSSFGATTLAIPLESPDTSFRTSGVNVALTLGTSRNDPARNHTNPLIAASDADVSSFDTDVHDSSDN